MSIDRYGIYIGKIITIHFYGVLIITGVILATIIASRQAKKRGYDPETAWDILPWVLIAGVIGARIWHILTPPPTMIERGITTYYYLTHPLDAIAIWNGGLGILGAVIGGAIALYIYTRRKEMSFLAWTDIIAPGLALAQAVGRWGNFVNQELYGAPTNLPWGIYIDPQHRLPGFENQAYYHPTFLYESILNVGNMFFLLWLGNRYREKLKDGDIFFVYLIVYPVIRFFMEFLRLDSSQVLGININQWTYVVIAIVAAALLILRHRFNWGTSSYVAVSESPESEKNTSEAQSAAKSQQTNP